MNINRLSIFALILQILIISGCSKNETAVFSISGRVKNPQTGKIVLLQESDIMRKQSKFVDTLTLDKDGKFSLDLNLEPHIYTLNFYNEKSITLAVDKGQKIVIEADGNDLSAISVSGSDDTAKLETYEKIRRESLDRLVISVRNRLKASGNYDSTDSEAAGIDEIENYEKHKAELNDFIRTEIGDSISLYATTLRWDGEDNFPFFKSLAKAFEKRHGLIDVTKRIKERIELLEKSSVGGNVNAIKIPDANGITTAFDPAKSRYTLIDFWASWCGPCRRESKTVGDVYSKYKAKGFDIYSISLDDDRGKWLEAVRKDGRIWTNVSTLSGFESTVAFEYGITALPAKFLVDSNGKIIAKNLNGVELKKKIEELFGK